MKRFRIAIPALFLFGHFLLGVTIVDDYGLSWDEPFQRLHALVNARYIHERLDLPGAPPPTEFNLHDYFDRFHGAVFTLSAYALERLFHADTYREIFQLRHRYTFFLFWLGGVVFYFMARHRLGSRRWGLLAWGFLLLSPRIFADSFYNPKDIPLLVFYLFATATFLLFLRKRSGWYAVLHALACGLAIGMRIVGVILPVLTIGFVFLECWQGRFRRDVLLAQGRKLLVFLPLLIGFTILFWPVLWEQPFHQFREAFAHMSKYEWPSKVLLRGTLIYATELPWYYAPYWFFITTPLWYTVLFFAGLAFLGRRILYTLADHGKIYTGGNSTRADLVLLGLFSGPLLAVIILESVLYDGWRHLYFIYPSFVLLATAGLKEWWQHAARGPDQRGSRCARRGLLLATGISLALTLNFMIRNHPHQNVYFNPLVLEDKLTHLDLDYWGLSYRQGFEALAARTPGDTLIRVAVQNDPGKFNYRFLPPELQARFKLVEEPQQADYFISVYRHWEEGIQAYRERRFPYDGQEVFSIEVEESKILGIYRMEDISN